jgi:SAM-dependent methyltransferase
MNINQIIVETCRNKHVLEVGGLGDYSRYIEVGMENWRHTWIKSVAERIVGVDINHEYVKNAVEHGYLYNFGDIEDFNTVKQLGKFEVVLFLDVMEHLNNVSLAIENIRKLLCPGGRVIITTPNAFSFSNLIRIATAKEPNEFPDHTCAFFSSHIKEIFRRQQIFLEKLLYVSFLDDRRKFRIKSKIIYLIGKRLKTVNTHLFIIGSKRLQDAK